MGFSVTSLCPKSSKHGQEMLSFFVCFLFFICLLCASSEDQVCTGSVSAAPQLCVLKGNACQTSGKIRELMRAGATGFLKFEEVAVSHCDFSPGGPCESRGLLGACAAGPLQQLLILCVLILNSGSPGIQTPSRMQKRDCVSLALKGARGPGRLFWLFGDWGGGHEARGAVRLADQQCD